jgi:hypothetical protein
VSRERKRMIETEWQGITMNIEEWGSAVSESEKESNHVACRKSASASPPPPSPFIVTYLMNATLESFVAVWLRTSFFWVASMGNWFQILLTDSEVTTHNSFTSKVCNTDLTYFVSSTISTSACAVIGVFECPAVGSSFANSPLVELTT